MRSLAFKHWYCFTCAKQYAPAVAVTGATVNDKGAAVPSGTGNVSPRGSQGVCILINGKASGFTGLDALHMPSMACLAIRSNGFRTSRASMANYPVSVQD